MQRRIPDYNVAFADFNRGRSIGGFGFGLTPAAVRLHRLAVARAAASRPTARVWEGAKGLEWTVPSPAPHHTFTTPPVIRDGDLAHGDITH